MFVVIYRQFGDFKNPSIVSDCTDDDGNTILPARFLHKPHDSRQWNWWSMNFTHEQSFQYNFVELWICSSRQEPIQLEQSSLIIYSNKLQRLSYNKPLVINPKSKARNSLITIKCEKIDWFQFLASDFEFTSNGLL